MQPRLLPDAEAGVAAYMVVSTQWRSGGFGRTGMDYTAVLGVLKLHLPRWRRDSRAFAGMSLADVLGDVQVIESAILRADDEKREENEARRSVQ